MQVKLHPGAKTDILKIFRDYLRESKQAAGGFIEKYEIAVEVILKSPTGQPKTTGNRRWRILDNYPYKIVYRVKGDVVWISSVVHTKRLKRNWPTRKWPK